MRDWLRNPTSSTTTGNGTPMDAQMNTQTRGGRLIRHGRRSVMVIASSTAVMLGVGVAYAAWTTTGTGNGTSQATGFNLPGVAVNATGVPSNALYPGGTSDLMVMATNNNPFPVTITLTMNVGAKVTSDKAGCSETTNGASSVTGVTLTSGIITVPATTTTAVAKSVLNAVAMSTASPTACIGALFTIPLNVSATSS